MDEVKFRVLNGVVSFQKRRVLHQSQCFLLEEPRFGFDLGVTLYAQT